MLLSYLLAGPHLKVVRSPQTPGAVLLATPALYGHRWRHWSHILHLKLKNYNPAIIWTLSTVPVNMLYQDRFIPAKSV